MPHYQPKTGAACHCKPGVHRDNCPDCEGTGMRINFRAIREASDAKYRAWLNMEHAKESAKATGNL